VTREPCFSLRRAREHVSRNAATQLWYVTDAGEAKVARVTSGSDNNDRLSTLWREAISLAGVARSLSKRMVRSISRSGTAMTLRQRRALIEGYKCHERKRH
jgi:hypothetical protein